MKKVASGFLPMIVVDRKLPEPLHRQIYDAYRLAIVDGRLRRGQRVPSTRMLAIELGVSRFPVVNAYAQLLAEGYFESRIGAGTVVCGSLPERFSRPEPIGTRFAASNTGPRPVARRVSSLRPYLVPPWLRGWGAFGVGQIGFDHFPVQIWSNLVARHCRRMSARSLHYSDQMGSLPLRETIASYLRTSRSVRCEADQVMIVSGSQEALEISARVLFDPGSSVWVENPGYGFAREALLLNGCELVPVPVDKEGMNVSAGIKLGRKARAAIVTPSHQFPMGVTMSAQRRIQLLNWAQGAGSWIIEDDYDSEYRFESSPIASLQGLDANGRVIYIGTFSKVLFPSLRLGYVVVPPDLVNAFVIVRRAMNLGGPTFLQEVLADFIHEGHFARHIRRMRVLYRERREELVENIYGELGSLVGVLGNEAGMHLTVTLPKGTNDVEIALRAGTQNLLVWPLSTAYLGEEIRPGFILGFGSTAREDIALSVRKLSRFVTGK